MSQRIFHLYRYQIIPNERIQEKLYLSENELSQKTNYLLMK